MEFRLLTQEEYDRKLREVIVGTEGHHARVQNVRDNRATIGWGYTLNRTDNVSTWRQAGIELTAEQNAVLLAAGIALQGGKPVCAIYSTFLQRAYDNIIHDVALQKLPVVLCLDRAGLGGDDGPTHHGVFDLSFLRTVPGMVVMAPAHERELNDMLATALSLDGPSAIRYPSGSGPGVDYTAAPSILRVGESEQLRDGHDVAIVAVGRMVENAREACELLSKQGIEARLVNARFVVPLDIECLRRAAADCGRIVTVEENVLVQLENLRTHPSVAAALSRQDLNVHGWVYKFETGQVFAYHPDEGHFLPLEETASAAVAPARISPLPPI